MVTGVLEEPLGIQEADRGQCFAQRFEQGLASPGARSAYDLLDLGEGLLDGIVVRGVAGQVQELQAPALDQLPYPTRLVCGKLSMRPPPDPPPAAREVGLALDKPRRPRRWSSPRPPEMVPSLLE